MFFGLQNSPATFQAMMDDYFRDMIDEGWIAIYMDDILIHTKTKEELQEKMKWVLEQLKEHDLYLKPVIVALIACASTQRVWHKYLVD